jgi:SAM-dependent methyltransferase
MLAPRRRGSVAAMFDSDPHERSAGIRPTARRALVLEMRRTAMAMQQVARQRLSEDGMTRPTLEEAHARADTARGSRSSALLYGPILWWGERAGNADRRRDLLATVHGQVLEVGAGTGLNVPLYPGGLDRLVLTEPEPNMVRRLERRLARLGLSAEVVRAPAEALPFDAGTFDTVVSTLVFCTVEDPAAALVEVARVLRPGGSLLFLEHTRSEEPRLARWQDRLHGPWRSFADGCNCNRRTLELLERAGFEVTVIERAAWRRMPAIVRPLVAGRAVTTGRNAGGPETS